MLSKVNIAPGIDKVTNYGAEGRWVDCTNVRFRSKLPEKIGGWTKLIDPKICGVVRAQKTWYSTAGVRFMALGTDRKLYVYSEGVVGSSLLDCLQLYLVLSPRTGLHITIAHTNHGATEGDFVTYGGASTLNGRL